MSREALDRFINVALKGNGQNGTCKIKDDGGAEDLEIGRCLESVNVEAGDSRDNEGRGRFFTFKPEHHLMNITPAWYWKNLYYPAESVRTNY